MKTPLTFLFVFTFFCVFSQKFETSTNYTFNNIEEEITQKYLSVPDSVREPLVIHVREKGSGKIVESIEITEAETFCGAWVEEQEISGYKNVKKALRISYDFCGCCSIVYETTYLVKDDGSLIPFPEVNYQACDWPEEKPAFQFKDENNPVVQEIKFVTEYRNDQGDLYKSEMIDTYTWNGKFIVKKKD